jgi:hypothetical protein
MTPMTTLSTKRLVENYLLDEQVVVSGQMLMEYEEITQELKDKIKNIDWEEENKSLFERNDNRVRMINKN